MKLLKGDAKAFYAILLIVVFALFSSNPSFADDTSPDPLPSEPDDISSRSLRSCWFPCFLPAIGRTGTLSTLFKLEGGLDLWLQKTKQK